MKTSGVKRPFISGVDLGDVKSISLRFYEKAPGRHAADLIAEGKELHLMQTLETGYSVSAHAKAELIEQAIAILRRKLA